MRDNNNYDPYRSILKNTRPLTRRVSNFFTNTFSKRRSTTRKNNKNHYDPYRSVLQNTRPFTRRVSNFFTSTFTRKRSKTGQKRKTLLQRSYNRGNNLVQSLVSFIRRTLKIKQKRD